MTDDEINVPCWVIEPEPTAAEFVALFTAMQTQVEIELLHGEPLDSRWAKIARREQLRTSLDDTGNGWNR